MLSGVELFAGAGGMAMGVAMAGVRHKAVIEWDKWACDTIRENIRAEFPLVADWRVAEGDVRDFDFSSIEDRIDIVTGGPPCQPFSLGGKHGAHDDDRDMFPVAVDVIRRLRPKAFILENVKGLTRERFANYFQYVILRLSFPEHPRRRNETWHDHLARLERHKTSGKKFGLTYDVVYRVLDAADYGVPQRRERVFIVGFRDDLAVKWSFPEPSHCLDQLLDEQWISRSYWERHGIPFKARATRPDWVAARIENLKKGVIELDDDKAPWLTVRDAISDLPQPRESGDNFFLNHRFQPGARAYPGHTGSPLDLPAKALKAGDHGVPGGENMMVLENGAVRYFTVRESARLQTFPDGFAFHGSWSEIMRQLGNAVPVKLAEIVARSVAVRLLEDDERSFKQAIRRITH